MAKPKQPKYSRIFAAHDDAAERAEYAAVVWAETVADMGDALTKTREAIVNRYVLMRVEYEFFYSSATHEGPVMKGPNGGDVFSMRFSALLKIGDTLMKLEDQLLISPRAAGERVKREPEKTPEAAGKYLARASKAH